MPLFTEEELANAVRDIQAVREWQEQAEERDKKEERKRLLADIGLNKLSNDDLLYLSRVGGIPALLHRLDGRICGEGS